MSWERAVEAVATQFAARVGRSGNLTSQERERIGLDLRAALPHLRQMIAAEIRAKASWMKGLNDAAVDRGRTELEYTLSRHRYEGVEFAADFVAKGEE